MGCIEACYFKRGICLRVQDHVHSLTTGLYEQIFLGGTD